MAGLTTIPQSNIYAMAFALVLGVALPLLIIVALLIKRRLSPRPLLVGLVSFIICFIIAAITGQIASVYIHNTALLIALLSLRAGLVEESARLISFKFFLKQNDRLSDAYSYGLGHGFCEAMLLLGMSYVSYITTALMFNSGTLTPVIEANPAAAQAYEQLISILSQTPASTFIMAGIERLSAMIFHVAASLFVFHAVKTRKYGYYLLAILLHTAFNCLTIPLALGLAGLVATEAMLVVAAIASLVFAIRLRPTEQKYEMMGPEL